MGFIPRAHQPTQKSLLLVIEEHKTLLWELWSLVAKAIEHAKSLWCKMLKYQLYHKGDRVWLEGMNLCTSHPTTKLRPKWFGPFEILEELSSVTFWLALPLTWKLYNTVHAALLSLYQEIVMHSKNYLVPAPKLIEGEPKWEINTILSSWCYGHIKELQYLVKWLRYPEANNL